LLGSLRCQLPHLLTYLAYEGSQLSSL
jgi:hypothetical protein